MKILLINYRYFVSGGPERYMFNAKKLLEDNGHTVIPFSVKSRKNEKTRYEKYFAEPMGGQDKTYFKEYKKTPKMILDIISRLFYSFHVKKKLHTLIQATKPDIAYILHHYNKLSPSVIDACYKSKLPIVLRLSDFFLLCPGVLLLKNGKVCEECLSKGYFSCVKNKCVEKSFLGSLLKYLAIRLQRDILKIYDKVNVFICTTNLMKRKMIEGGFPEEKLHIVKTFIYTKKNVYKSSSNHEPYILYFGRINFEKGLDVLVKGYIISNLHKKNIRLKVIGGKLVDMPWIKIDNKDINIVKHYIDFIDFINQDKLEKYIANCLFTVVPSRCYDNLPNTILESYKHNKPVIATNLGSIPEVVENNKTGLLFQNEDVEDLASKMNLLYNDKDLYKNMVDNISKYVLNFSGEKHIRSLEEIFTKLAS